MSRYETYARLTKPWLIESGHGDAMIETLARNPQVSATEIEVKQDEASTIDIADQKIAVIPLKGMMMQEPSLLERVILGATDTNAFTEQVKSMEWDNEDVSGVLLDVSTGGGSVGGVIEAGEAVKQLGKSIPVVAYTGGMMASAGYWVGSQANLIVASPSSMTGSIGVYQPIVDTTKAYEEMGVKVELITNKDGIYKGAGYDGTEITKAQRALIASEVEQIFQTFKETVKAKRPVNDKAMRGQSFLAKQAKQEGLIDVIGSKEDAVALLLAEISLRANK